MSNPTHRDTELCLLKLCGSKLTVKQIDRLRILGLVAKDSPSFAPVLSPLGFVHAYSQLAEIRFGGSNPNREVIAGAARDEAESWRKEVKSWANLP